MRISDWSSDVCSSVLSQGEWEAFGEDEQADYGEVVDWVTQQAFCDGRIGVYGVSYLGITAIITAAQNHPDRKSVVSGQSVSVRVDLGGRRIIKNKTSQTVTQYNT